MQHREQAVFSPPGDWIDALHDYYHVDESSALDALVADLGLSDEQREEIVAVATAYVEQVRDESSPSMMEAFLAEYGLSTAEGIGLMCLAEALLRVPDADTIDDLIHDKIEPSDWGAHLGHSSSSLVNAARPYSPCRGTRGAQRGAAVDADPGKAVCPRS